MAKITEDEKEKESLIKPASDSNSKSKPMSASAATNSDSGNGVAIGAAGSKTSLNSNPSPFVFWFYLTLTVSLITLIFVFILSFQTPRDPKTWFLSLPEQLRLHYSEGREVKVQLRPNQKPIEVFSLSRGPTFGESVLIVHGLGLSSFDFRGLVDDLGFKGLRAVAVDLPGCGFSEKGLVEIDKEVSGVFWKVWSVFDLIKEKGVFWAFDQMVESGQIPYEEIERLVMSRTRVSVRVLEIGSEEVAKVLSQLIEGLRLSPVHLVLHDSALVMCANWVVENAGKVKSVTLVDTGLNGGTVFPVWALKVPVVRELMLGVSGLYAKVVDSCCSKRIDGLSLEAQRAFLRGRNGWEAIVGMGKRLNQSFDLAQWGELKELENVPMQVVWSDVWSEDWRNEGKQVALKLPQARFVKHSGGRWPKDTAAVDMADSINSFVSSLPKTIRQVDQESKPEHIQQNKNHGHQESHSHDEIPGYVDAYGLGHAWAS